MTPSTASTFEMQLMNLQRTAAGFCIALLLVAGLVSVPTSCDCGAGIAHGHSLFILSGHHHGSAGAVFGAEPDPHGHHHDGNDGHNAKETPSVEAPAQLMGRIMHSSDRVAVSIPLSNVMSSSWQRVTYPTYSEVTSEGQAILPEAPPPQQLWTI